MRLKDKSIVVTGGTSGIGRQIVKDLLREGAEVVMLSRSKTLLDDVITEEGDKKVFGFQCDISDGDQVQKSFGELIDELGKCDGLVNNAGINPSRNNILDTSFDDWAKTLNVNLTGAYHCSKAAISLMKKNKSGSIVNISSVTGITSHEKRTAYMGSKWGMIGLSSSLAIDFAKDNIRVNTICPGYVNTPLVSEYLSNLNDNEKENLINSHLMGRIGTPRDISPIVTFLLSDEASWITGTVIPVDGGYSLGKSKLY